MSEQKPPAAAGPVELVLGPAPEREAAAHPPLPKPAHYWRDDVPGRAGPLLSPLFTSAQVLDYAGQCVREATAECSEHWQRRLDAAVAAERERCRAALQEAETIMGHNDEHTDWRERWQHLWPWGGPNVRANGLAPARSDE